MTFSDAPEKGEGWKKVVITERSANNFRYAQFPYISNPGGTQRTYSVEYDMGSITGYRWRLDGSGGYSNIGVTGTGRFQFTITPGVTGVYALFLTNGSSATGINDTIYYRYYQVENNAHATPFTPGTRSATQGLLDLTGNSTIDLSNVSFDSNAQKTFDGTNDGVDLGTGYSYFTNKSFCLETIIKPNTSPPAQQVFFAAVGPVGGIQKNIHFRVYDSGALRMGFLSNDLDTSSGVVTFGQYHHVVMQYNYSLDTSYIYVNGELLVSGNQGPFIDSSARITVGFWYGSGQYFKGEIPVTKVHSRVLTADEIRNNYRHYKTRFDI
jgi:hypothetical protein